MRKVQTVRTRMSRCKRARRPIATVQRLFVLAALLLAGCEASSQIFPPSAENAITISTRQSLLDSKTGALCIQSKTPSPLNISLDFRNLDNQQQKLHKAEVPAYGSLEVGILECGWALAPNETVVISVPGYASVKYKTHRTSEGLIGISRAFW